jgi:hypothetical protein
MLLPDYTAQQARRQPATFSDQVDHQHLTLECSAWDSSVKNTGHSKQDPFDVLNDQRKKRIQTSQQLN